MFRLEIAIASPSFVSLFSTFPFLCVQLFLLHEFSLTLFTYGVHMLLAWLCSDARYLKSLQIITIWLFGGFWRFLTSLKPTKPMTYYWLRVFGSFVVEEAVHNLTGCRIYNLENCDQLVCRLFWQQWIWWCWQWWWSTLMLPSMRPTQTSPPSSVYLIIDVQ